LEESTGGVTPKQSLRRILGMKLTRLAFLTATAAIFSGSVFAQELPSQKVITFDLAHAIAQEAMAVCHAQGYKVTVIVVDATNTMKVLLRDDGATMSSVETGLLKTNTVVLRGGNPTGPPPTLPPGTPLPTPTVPNTIYGMGGIPIKVGTQVIGALSVSGAPSGPILGDKDAACAKAGLAKFTDRLK
jgi:uncharacterized protein GlcG (DUF336 family)